MKERFVDLNEKNILSFEPYIPTEYLELILQEDYFGIGAVRGTAACGAVMLHYERESSVLKMLSVCVDEAVRKQGIGERLFDQVKGLAESLPVKTIEYDYIEPERVEDRGYLYRLGFAQIVPEESLYEIDGEDLRSFLAEERMKPYQRACKKWAAKGVYLRMGELPGHLRADYRLEGADERRSIIIVHKNMAKGALYVQHMANNSYLLRLMINRGATPEQMSGMLYGVLREIAGLLTKNGRVTIHELRPASQDLFDFFSEGYMDKIHQSTVYRGIYRLEGVNASASLSLTEYDILFPRMNALMYYFSGIGRESLLLQEESSVLLEVKRDKAKLPFFFRYIVEDPDDLTAFCLEAITIKDSGEVVVLGRLEERGGMSSDKELEKFTASAEKKLVKLEK